MFFYIDNPSALLNPAGGSINNALGLGGGGPVSIALSTNPEADTLHATLWTRKQEPAADSSWRQLATEPVDPELLRAIPPESLAFIAVADQDLETKLAKIRDWFKANAVNEFPRAIEALETTPFNSLLEQTSSAIIGSYPNAALLKISESVKELGNLSGLQIYRPFYFAALEFTDPAPGEEALREALRKYAESLPGASKNLEFMDQHLELQGEAATHHYLKPLAGIRPGYIRIKNQFLISMSPEILKAALRSRQLDAGNRLSIPPKGASKVLYLRPKPIFSALSLLSSRSMVVSSSAVSLKVPTCSHACPQAIVLVV